MKKGSIKVDFAENNQLCNHGCASAGPGTVSANCSCLVVPQMPLFHYPRLPPCLEVVLEREGCCESATDNDLPTRCHRSTKVVAMNIEKHLKETVH